MKYFFVAVILTLLLITTILVERSYGQQSTFQWHSRQQEGLKRNVWTVHTVEYLFGEALGSSLQVFDTCGLPTDRLSYLNGTAPDAPQSPVYQFQKTIYVYDDSGRIKIRKTCDETLSVCGEAIYKYDTKNRLIEEIMSGEYGFRKLAYDYGNDKNKIKVTYYNGSETHLSRSGLATYDSKGNQIEWIVFLKEKDILLRHTFHYDKKGNLTEKIDYDHDNKPQFVYKYVYKFDLQGNWIEQQTFLNYTRNGVKKSDRRLTVNRTIVYYQNKNKYRDDFRCSSKNSHFKVI
ncbi:MAG TPA: hypothetical protein VF556_02235 [Pyrinomonadaceae bacterium]|jgi:hypothetical protein